MEQPFFYNGCTITLSSNCQFTHVEAGWSYQQHYHDCYELLYCHQGKITEWIHGESIIMSKGDWLLIGPGVRHSTINGSIESFAYFSLHFDLEDIEIRNELKNINFVHILHSLHPLNDIYKEIQEFMQDNLQQVTAPSLDNHARQEIHFTNVQKLLFQSKILVLFAEVMQMISSQNNAIRLNRKLLNVQEIELANTIERMLSENDQTPITINQIAKELYISRSYCNEVFKKVYGIAPRQYLSMLKLKKAESLILYSDLSMEAISEKLGFSCMGSFSRQFRRWTQLSPLQFKKSK